MGLALSRIYGSLSSLAFWSKDKEVRILMVGLDSAGKVSGLGEGVHDSETGRGILARLVGPGVSVTEAAWRTQAFRKVDK